MMIKKTILSGVSILVIVGALIGLYISLTADKTSLILDVYLLSCGVAFAWSAVIISCTNMKWLMLVMCSVCLTLGIGLFWFIPHHNHRTSVGQREQVLRILQAEAALYEKTGQYTDNIQDLFYFDSKINGTNVSLELRGAGEAEYFIIRQESSDNEESHYTMAGNANGLELTCSERPGCDNGVWELDSVTMPDPEPKHWTPSSLFMGEGFKIPNTGGSCSANGQHDESDDNKFSPDNPEAFPPRCK